MGHISQPFALAKTGLAKISGGAQQWGAPNTGFFNVGASGLTINEVRYVPLYVAYQITLTAWQLEVTTGPSGAANLRLGIYAADKDLQPNNGLYYDSGSVAVANGFTGIKTATGINTVLTPGMYLVALNCDTAMSLRTFISASPIIAASLGATPVVQRVAVAQTFGAFPSPGTAWTTPNAVAGGLQHFAVWQWTE